jgi:uncharacterized protein (TIGR03435 family)
MPRSLRIPASFVAAILFVACKVPAQRSHNGPVKTIATARTLQPFDIVSVKQNKTGSPAYIDIDDKGIFTAVDVPLEAIIDAAYDIKPDQIVGLTGPVTSARFDITAKMLPPGAAAPAMLPSGDLEARVVLVLEDRFHLKAHVEPRVKPVYDLVIAKGGPKIKLSQDEIHFSNCQAVRQGTNKAIYGRNCSMADVASELSDGVDRKVIDKTGLAGHADITLKWSDDVALTQGDADAISIFTAIEEQLGLKLQPSKGPIDTLVIDHVEMPSEN